jgi:hypothetical protein
MWCTVTELMQLYGDKAKRIDRNRDKQVLFGVNLEITKFESKGDGDWISLHISSREGLKPESVRASRGARGSKTPDEEALL